MILRERFPTDGIPHDVGKNPQEILGWLYPPVSGYRLNYVVSQSAGSANSELATNKIDRDLLRFIRSQSDLIITSGATARDENLNSSSYAPMLILTRSDELFDIPAVTNNSAHAVYLTQKLDTMYSNSDALAIGQVQLGVVEFCESFIQMHNFEKVVLETGETLAHEFAKAGLLAEINLTVTGVEDLGAATTIANQFIESLGLEALPVLQLLQHADSWFFRFASSKAKTQ